MMLLSSYLTFALLSPLVYSCAPSNPRLSRRDATNSTNNTTTTTTGTLPYPSAVIGTDPPQPPATAGYALNHVALRVSNLTASRAFYGDILGFRFIFSFPIEDPDNERGQHLLTFMGYPFGDGTVGDQTGTEILGELRKRDGLLELFSAEESSPQPLPPLHASSFTPGFSHLGLAVPNITDTEAWLEANDVPIVKRAGVPAGEEIEDYFGLDPGATSQFSTSVKALFGAVIIAKDPDGYAIEFSQAE